MKVATAAIERRDNLASPTTPWPLVQPEPMREPKPTSRPPATSSGQDDVTVTTGQVPKTR